MRITAILLAMMCLCIPESQAIEVTRTTCNYQSSPAIIQGTAPSLGWQLASATPGDSQSAYQVKVTERVTGRRIHDTRRVSSSESQRITLPQLPYSPYGYTWQVRVWDARGKASAWSAPSDFRIMPQSLDARWVGALSTEKAHIPEGRWANTQFKQEEFKQAWKDTDTLSTRSIVVSRTFDATSSKKITDAVVYVSGLGHYVLSINGQRVGDSEFAPLWSEYTKTIYYNVYDVTPLVRSGQANSIEALLGNGFFNVQKDGRYTKLQTSFGTPRLLLRMDISYSDGTRQTVVTDDKWQWRYSRVTFNSIYGGESHDAFAPQAASQPVEVLPDMPATLRAQTAPPVKLMERFPVKKVTPVPADSLTAAAKAMKRDTVMAGAFVCDMGQNLAGFPEITVKGRPGQKVTLYVGETLTRQGVVNQRETGRQHYYEYTIGTTDSETWHPHFSYYGYRYIQVEGAVLAGDPNPMSLPVMENLQSCFIYNSAPETSSFECSNDIFTRTHRLIERAERSNMQAVLTDCPHREKLGWLEQDHLNGPSLLQNFDLTTYVPKVIRDITDTQRPDGMVPTTCPQYCSFGNLFDDSPEWGSTLVILPFQYYEQYGDSTLITDNYGAMAAYTDYLTSRSEDHIVSHGLGDWYDFQPGVTSGFSHNTSIPLVATAHYIYDLQLMSRAARIVGNDADCERYTRLYGQTVDAFNRHFWKADSLIYDTGSQTALSLPLWLGICGDNKQAVLDNLVRDIHLKGDRLSTGDVGNRYLFQTLAREGQTELLYRMLNHYDTPGYGYQLRHGATTLTEQWDPSKGTSQNHFMMGQIDEWLLRGMAGIGQRQGTFGMRHLEIRPTLPGDLQSVSATMQTLYGTVSVRATRTTLEVTIPIGCDALLHLPDGTTTTVGSGTHRF